MRKSKIEGKVSNKEDIHYDEIINTMPSGYVMCDKCGFYALYTERLTGNICKVCREGGVVKESPIPSSAREVVTTIKNKVNFEGNILSIPDEATLYKLDDKFDYIEIRSIKIKIGRIILPIGLKIIEAMSSNFSRGDTIEKVKENFKVLINYRRA